MAITEQRPYTLCPLSAMGPIAITSESCYLTLKQGEELATQRLQNLISLKAYVQETQAKHSSFGAFACIHLSILNPVNSH